MPGQGYKSLKQCTFETLKLKRTPFTGWYFNGNQYVKLSSDCKKSTIIITKRNVFEPLANATSRPCISTQLAARLLSVVRCVLTNLQQFKQDI